MGIFVGANPRVRPGFGQTCRSASTDAHFFRHFRQSKALQSDGEHVSLIVMNHLTGNTSVFRRTAHRLMCVTMMCCISTTGTPGREALR